MKIKIYQINKERDRRDLKFMDLDYTKCVMKSPEIDVTIYDRVFVGDVECNDLEEVYHLFNEEGHRLHRGHSLSVSDIVEVDTGSITNFYFCDSFGFKMVSFESEQAKMQDDVIRVLVVEPHRVPYESEIKNTLEGQQRAVGGRIEYVYNDDNTIIVINEEGKINGSDGNRRIEGDVLCGSFFIAGDDGENLCSLTEEQIKKYQDRFAEPENISREEIEDHTGFTFISW
ncbi:MAG: DUF3846 domain-containing protein [Eubacterium sp.]|nr:DUF3846 domain-containing protein [Eubacterium sp.]